MKQQVYEEALKRILEITRQQWENHTSHVAPAARSSGDIVLMKVEQIAHKALAK